MRSTKFTPKTYLKIETESIAGVLNIGFYLLPLFLLIVLIRQFIQADYDMMVVIGIAILTSLYIRHQFLLGNMERSIMCIAVFFSMLLTIVCSLGNGIHDIGLIGYPIIIAFSSIILDQQKLAIASVLSIAGLTWLVVGEMFGLYTPAPTTPGSLGDFIVSSLLIVIGGFVAFSLTRNMRVSAFKAQREVAISKKEALVLGKEIEEKTEIISEIHKAAINSLSHIIQLIRHKESKEAELVPLYESLKRKILVIEESHEILLEAGDPLMLDITRLSKNLLIKYRETLKSSLLQIDVGEVPCYLRQDLAINYGICMLELINCVDAQDDSAILVKLEINKPTIKLRLMGLKGDKMPESIMIDLLTRQLKGSLTQSENELSLTFNSVK
ncbi:MAG: hypothetical protein RLN88_00675 [Ekhidna sp.]|uniref:hypothetical protein n=1 Tax=Ekhidna sp. TaxID=2608089 RepID=UPI0032EDE231